MQTGFSAVVIAFMLICGSGYSRSADLWTHQYVVPPTFLAITSQDGLSRDRRSAKEILSAAGVEFGEGATAIYNPATSMLIVRNTKQQMQLIETFIDLLLDGGVESQIYLQIREITFPRRQFARLQLEPEVAFAFKPSIPVDGKVPDRGVFRQALRPSHRQIMLSHLEKIEAITIHQRLTLMLRTNVPGTLNAGKRIYGLSAAIGTNGALLDLCLYLPNEGETLLKDPNQLKPDISVTIWDGYTAIIEKRSTEAITWVLVTAQLCDPAGMPINPNGGLRGAEE
ncbi:MAG: hypothetical protein P1V20_15920 [Verrucomicrobiales bacterium]|nr:hypothetical protein [Verrucomicrobiales bacterium]